MAKAVGVGGVFLKARDPKSLSAWYAAHFGINPGEGAYVVFDGAESAGMTLLSHFPQDTAYFGDSGQNFMLNLRVDDLDEILVNLAAAGVRIDPHREEYGYGRFAWIWDPEGNRVELWQPLP
jgi:predicted enzyme related to lactoylglutathione lyase